MGIRGVPSFNTSDPTTLLLDNATYSSKQKNILSSEEKLVLDTTPLELENEACGTECMCLITDYWKQTEDAGIKFREFTCNDVNLLLTRVMQSINKTSVDVADSLKVDDSSENTTLVAAGDPFDDEGKYGGNQSGPDKGLNLFGWVIWKDDDLYDFVRKHPGYENYTDSQIHKLLSDLENGGCSYVAAVNAIFNSFKGREDEFEKTFGFPMCAENGDLNYDLLIVDYFLETNDKVFFDSPNGLDAYATTKVNYYKEHEDEYEALYGESLYDSDGKLSKNWYTNCFNEAVALYNSGATYAEIDIDGATTTSVINKMDHYCQEHGLSMTTYNITGDQMSNEDIQYAIDHGYTVVFAAENFELQYKNGFKYNFGIDIGGHEMTITGIDDEGRYIVSTWGEKLYLDLEDNSDDMELWGYYAIKIN